MAIKENLLNCKIKITIKCTTMDPHLSGRSDYPDWVMTVQLQCFVGSVCFIRVFEYSSVYKCIGFNYTEFSVI